MGFGTPKVGGPAVPAASTTTKNPPMKGVRRMKGARGMASGRGLKTGAS